MAAISSLTTRSGAGALILTLRRRRGIEPAMKVLQFRYTPSQDVYDRPPCPFSRIYGRATLPETTSDVTGRCAWLSPWLSSSTGARASTSARGC
jgi:hypothetical protein